MVLSFLAWHNMEENIDRLPRISALTFYVKLYCKKKENVQIKNKMLKATESWVSLSEDEKQQFIDKLKELQNSYKKTFAEYLKHAEVFMKKKKPKKLIDTNISIEDNPKPDNLSSEPASQSPNNITCMEVDANHSNMNESNNVFYPKMPEPVPPNIKSAKDLYELIQKNKGTDSIYWKSLSPTEKKRYQNAVLSLKKEYIKRYREYLDCLSSKELFSHYIKTI